MIYLCCKEMRRVAVQSSPVNGIDFLEVLDDPSLPDDQQQRTLFVHFVKDLGGLSGTTAHNVRIEGGERIRGITVTDVRPSVDDTTVLQVRVDRAGDFSTYTLRLVADAADPNSLPLGGVDRESAAVDFSFKAGCDTDSDCLAPPPCPPPVYDEPVVDYLAKDYPSFERLILDRMSALVPQWTERNPADAGVMLTEVLAYVGDELSYQQDAVATEAYLGTAHRRVSVRRHARLVDYAMHDGCNARTWVRFDVSADLPLDAQGRTQLPQPLQLLTRLPNLDPVIAPDSQEYRDALAAGATVFEVMAGAWELYTDHDTLHFHTWGSEDCCLPAGATAATLRDQHPNLKAGDVLIFEEIAGPVSGLPGDADPTRRWAVRLAGVVPDDDQVENVQVTRITWAAADALPFPLTVSVHDAHGALQETAVARGNVVLADHGQSLDPEPLEAVEPDSSALEAVQEAPTDPCTPPTSLRLPVRYAPVLRNAPLTQASPAPAPASSASASLRTDAHGALPAIRLDSSLGAWEPRRDLLASDPTQRHFVAEVDDAGDATLRFGDGRTHGRRPQEGVALTASYRIGNGSAGNIGAQTLAHVVVDTTTVAGSAITGAENPMPARGGVDPQSIEDVRQKAPVAFRTQLRAVTPADYAQFAEQGPDPGDPEVLRAVATFRWTGSWHTVFVTVDRRGGLEVDEPFRQAVRDFLEPYRMAGHDIEVEGPVYAPLELAMTVCVKPDYFRAAVGQRLREVFSNRVLPDGTRGVFHPDNFDFGQTVYLSPLYAAAQSVDGVEHVDITQFGRWGSTDTAALQKGWLTLARLELPRLDSDPNFPDHGNVDITLVGGK